MSPLNPADRLTASLEAQQWNQVLALLAEAPYRLTAPIIQSLHEQLNVPQSRGGNIVPMEAS
jgi:hypothetical protein